MTNDLETRRRLSRLKTEALLLSQQHDNVRFDTQIGTWFYVERFAIAPDWNKTHIELLIDIPHGTPGYPSVPQSDSGPTMISVPERASLSTIFHARTEQ